MGRGFVFGVAMVFDFHMNVGILDIIVFFCHILLYPNYSFYKFYIPYDMTTWRHGDMAGCQLTYKNPIP